ncbi:MAG: YraN family protein [Dokdonella sp.]
MRTTGDHYEMLAKEHLEKNGLLLIARNFNCRHGEIDLVMQDGSTVVFAEVRFRRSAGFGGALASVGASKRQRLIKAASMFLLARPELASRPCRFDVVAIEGAALPPAILWCRNAFET